MQIPKRKPGKYADLKQDYNMTPAALEGLKQEIERLEVRVRPKVVEELRQAREMGDLSENFAYTAAKGKLAGIDMRVFEMKERIKHAVLIAPGAAADGSARLGARVTVEVNGHERVFEIVGPQETDPAKGRISQLSPLGSVLLKRKPGETVTVEANGKTAEYRILKVE
jgi:transcription elongation factor GreA